VPALVTGLGEVRDLVTTVTGGLQSRDRGGVVLFGEGAGGPPGPGAESHVDPRPERPRVGEVIERDVGGPRSRRGIDVGRGVTPGLPRDAEYQVDVPLPPSAGRDGGERVVDLLLRHPSPERHAQRRRERLHSQREPRRPGGRQVPQQGRLDSAGVGLDGEL